MQLAQRHLYAKQVDLLKVFDMLDGFSGSCFVVVCNFITHFNSYIHARIARTFGQALRGYGCWFVGQRCSR